MGRLYGDDDVIAGLAFIDANVVGPDFVALGGDVGDDLLLIGADDRHVAVIGRYLQIRAGGDGIGLRPVVRARRDGGEGETCEK